jgi:hypothetical protein
MDDVSVVPGESDSITLAGLVSGSPKRAVLSSADSVLLSQSFKRLLSAASDKSSAWTGRGAVEDVVVMSRAPEPGSPLRSFKGIVLFWFCFVFFTKRLNKGLVLLTQVRKRCFVLCLTCLAKKSGIRCFDVVIIC